MTDGVLDNMLYGLMTYTAKRYGDKGKPCVACYNWKKVPKIAPIPWEVEDYCYDNVCPFMCTIWHMRVDAERQVATFTDVHGNMP